MPEEDIILDQDDRLDLIRLQFKQVKNIGWFRHFVLIWTRDSRYGIVEDVNEFLDKQIRVENQQLKGLAQTLKGSHPDITMINILKYVVKHIRYRNDVGEQWYYATQILRRQYDDCDGINSLIYVLARYADIPSYLLSCGLVDTADEDEEIDHFTLFYWSTKSYDGISTYLYNIDGTYNVDFTPIKHRLPFNIGSGIKRVYYLFDEYNTWKVG